jgi:hypothetical protein
MGSKFASSWGGWCSSELFGAFWVSLWRNITRGWGNLWWHTSFKVGDDFKIRFWHD